MRILIGSNSPLTNSGYGIQSYYLCKSLLEYGHEIIFLCWNLQGDEKYRNKLLDYETIKKLSLDSKSYELEAILEKEDVCKQLKYYICIYPVFPCELMVNDINNILIKENIDVHIYILDIWIIESHKKFARPSLTWLPLHFIPLEENTLHTLDNFNRLVFLSNFGIDVVKNSVKDFDVSKHSLIPHFIDYDTFQKSLSDMTREKFREIVGITKIEKEKNKEVKLVSIVARNSEESNRKCFDLNVMGFKKLLDKGVDAYLYIHSGLIGKVNILKCINYYNVPNERILYPVQEKMITSGYLSDYMYGIYLGSDVLLACSGSEGFGLPILEAQLLKCPVVTTRCTAMLDYLYYGEYVDVLDDKFVYANSSYWYIPDPNDIGEKLYKVLNYSDSYKEEKSQYGQDKIKNEFSLKYLGKKWNDIIMSYKNTKNRIKK